jgi:hypothetical protein
MESSYLMSETNGSTIVSACCTTGALKMNLLKLNIAINDEIVCRGINQPIPLQII